MDTVNTYALFLKFPHIAKKVKATWGSAECHTFLNSLIGDSRDGKRKGFEPHDAKTIFALLQRHDEVYPAFDTTKDTVIPFTGIRERVPVQQKHKSMYDSISALIGMALFCFVLYKAIRWMHG